jgi:hypothetical protein
MDARKQTFGLLNQGCLTREGGAVGLGDEAEVTVSVVRAKGGTLARILRRSLRCPSVPKIGFGCTADEVRLGPDFEVMTPVR